LARERAAPKKPLEGRFPLEKRNPLDLRKVHHVPLVLPDDATGVAGVGVAGFRQETPGAVVADIVGKQDLIEILEVGAEPGQIVKAKTCLLYTSDAADE